jgi:hypothetical protein
MSTRLARGSLPWPVLPALEPTATRPACRGSLTVEAPLGTRLRITAWPRSLPDGTRWLSIELETYPSGGRKHHCMERPEMTKKSDHLEVVNTAGLTDADWAEINRLKKVYDAGGQKALSAALDELEQKVLSEKDPTQVIDAIDAFWRVKGALFPGFLGHLREVIRDNLAENGITEEDLRELIRELTRKLESPSRGRH